MNDQSIIETAVLIVLQAAVHGPMDERPRALRIYNRIVSGTGWNYNMERQQEIVRTAYELG